MINIFRHRNQEVQEKNVEETHPLCVFYGLGACWLQVPLMLVFVTSAKPFTLKDKIEADDKAASFPNM